MSSPLAGRRILVTRAVHQAGRLSEGLRALGAQPVEVPVLEIAPPESYEALDLALHVLARYDWLIFTSANAVRIAAERASKNGVVFSTPSLFRVAAIGPATAAEVRKAGLEATLVPEMDFRAEGLIAALAGQAAGKRVVLIRAAIARDLLPATLRKAGATVEVIDAYRNVVPASAPAQLRAALDTGIEAATFTSSSSVSHLAEAARAAGMVFPFEGVAAISIGPITTKTLRKHNWPPAAEANPSDMPGLIAAAERHFLSPSSL